MKLELAGIELSADFGEDENYLAEVMLQVVGKMSLGYNVEESFGFIFNKAHKCCGNCKKEEKQEETLSEYAEALAEFAETLTSNQIQKSLEKAKEKETMCVENGIGKESPNYKFVIGECSCGQQHYLPIYENANSPYHIKCRKCGKSAPVEYDKLVKQYTECAICGHVSEFWMSPDDKNLKKIDCRSCKARVSIK